MDIANYLSSGLITEITSYLDKQWVLIPLLVVSLVVARKLTSIIGEKVIRRAIKPDEDAPARAEKAREDTLIHVLNTLIRVGVYTFGGMIVLSQLGINIGPLIAGVSILGLAIGFGAQEIVKDFVSGVFVIMENQYRIGDVVTLADRTGTVEEINIRQTILRDVDGHRHYIPNGQIGVSSNLTMGYVNLNLNLGVSYDADLDEVAGVINRVGSDLAEKMPDQIIDKPQFVRINDFKADEVEVRVMGKVQPASQWEVAGEFRKLIKRAFDEAGIEIPYRQIVVHQKKA